MRSICTLSEAYVRSVRAVAQLPGIGPELAQRIVEYREGYGPFQTAEEIMLVSGIGEKKYEDMKDRITVEVTE